MDDGATDASCYLQPTPIPTPTYHNEQPTNIPTHYSLVESNAGRPPGYRPVIITPPPIRIRRPSIVKRPRHRPRIRVCLPRSRDGPGGAAEAVVERLRLLSKFHELIDSAGYCERYGQGKGCSACRQSAVRLDMLADVMHIPIK